MKQILHISIVGKHKELVKIVNQFDNSNVYSITHIKKVVAFNEKVKSSDVFIYFKDLVK